eukprot:COSAG01_NODE_2851_length_6937_cov_13.682228_13_plen_57_part_00
MGEAGRLDEIARLQQAVVQAKLALEAADAAGEATQVRQTPGAQPTHSTDTHTAPPN